MADLVKDLRHMKRSDLVEIIYSYQQSEKALQAENEALKKAISNRRLKMSEVGSIAEAAPSLNGVFEAAQTAADQYLTEAKFLNDNAEIAARKIISKAQKQANEIRLQTQKYCMEIKQKTEEECRLMREEAKKNKSREKKRNIFDELGDI